MSVSNENLLKAKSPGNMIKFIGGGAAGDGKEADGKKDTAPGGGGIEGYRSKAR